MEDLVGRGVVTRLNSSEYQIPSDTLQSGRSSITIGAAVGGDKRRFNLKWLYEYHWLRFDPGENSMLCAMCKHGKRANQFAKLGSKNFKTSAIVDHSTSNDHKRSLLTQIGAMDSKSDPAAVALALVDGVWMAQPCRTVVSPVVEEEKESTILRPVVATSSSDQPLCAIEGNPVVSEEALATSFADAVGPRTVAQQSVSANSYSTIESISSVASQTTPTTSSTKVPAEQEEGAGPLVSTVASTDSSAAAARRGSSSTQTRHTSGSAAAVPDERYAKEFEHAVQALLQAMSLNLPINSVADLYRLQMQPTPLADIGSHGHARRRLSPVRLAGAYTNSTEAARTLQHVVSSELLSLIKDEVSQSPAFSVIIDEAPLREHNSLVAHVLLYLRYLRRDPESPEGSLQAITRFWRCVHLYHENNGRLARRDPTSLVLTLLERAKVDSSRLVCISCERPVTHEDEEVERTRQPHVIHWHGIFTHPHSLSPQVYEEITNRSDDFVHFAMTLMDLCLFMYSHPSSFAFLGVEFQEMLYKTLYEIFLGEGSISTRLPISLTPAIVIALTRNISQIMATVLALSRVETTSQAAGVNMPDHRAGGDAAPLAAATVAVPKSPRSSLQIPLPIVDMLVSSFGGGSRMGPKQSVGRCPPADALLEKLRDYGFLGCLHFLADIMSQVKPIIDIAGRSDMPTRVLGVLSEPADHTLDQRLRAYIGTIKDAIESVTLMYGDEEASDDVQENGGSGGGGSSEEEFSGFHLNEFMHLTGSNDDEEDGSDCYFRSFAVVNYSRLESQARLVELIRTVSSAILHDLHQRFSSKDIATIQALADMWDPTQFPRDPTQVAVFANTQVQALTEQMSSTHTGSSPEGLKLVVPQSTEMPRSPVSARLADPAAVQVEWSVFKTQVHQQAEAEMPSAEAVRYAPGKIQETYRGKLFPGGALAQSMRRLRSVEEGASPINHVPSPSEASSTNFGNLAKLATAWNVLPLALSTDLYFFRRFYERQLARICREQAENKLQSINFDIGDTFSELISRLSSPEQQHKNKKKRVTVYDLIQNSKVEVEQNIGGVEKPVLGEFELSGVTVDYFVRSIDAVTMALDHRLRLLSLEFMESPVAVSKTPGGCPKWLQNAMRGYWKLACRPPKYASSAIVPAASHGIRQRTHTISNNSAAAGGGSVAMPWSTCTTTHTSDHPVEPAETMAAATVSNAQQPPVPIMPADSGRVLSAQTSICPMPSALIAASTDQQQQQQRLSSISAAICATVQPAAAVSGDLSTLPLLEALLSDPTNVPAPPRSSSSQDPITPSRIGIKRPIDASTAATELGSTMNYVVGGGSLQQQQQQQLRVDGNKRMRHSADSAVSAMPLSADPYGYGGGPNYQQHGYPGMKNGGGEESFTTAIARLASDHAASAAAGSNRGFSVSMPNQLMPPPPPPPPSASSSSTFMDGGDAHAANMFAAAAAMQQQQQRDQEAASAMAAAAAAHQHHRYSQFQHQQQQFHQQQQQQQGFAQLAFVSQAAAAAALNIQALPVLPSSAPVMVGGGGLQEDQRGRMHTATAASFDQMIREQNYRYHQGGGRQHEIHQQPIPLPPPPPPPPAGPFGYQMHGFLPDNNK
ncbi:hypothetical protein IWW38_000355 [Coemansia aciculifera]|uniref:Uncharacterized protein n=1 Tax=Coemansia aciculifera TaxID=417176 RepID=A0ACC1MB02_9FUNG|nr:hypothetical protein IWW38_000355 [Coemansia aciculifera]